jgi:hypothetical protein
MSLLGSIYNIISNTKTVTHREFRSVEHDEKKK